MPSLCAVEPLPTRVLSCLLCRTRSSPRRKRRPRRRRNTRAASSKPCWKSAKPSLSSATCPHSSTISPNASTRSSISISSRLHCTIPRATSCACTFSKRACPTTNRLGSEAPVDGHPSGWVWQSQETFVVSDTAEEERYPEFMQRLRDEGVRSLRARPAHHRATPARRHGFRPPDPAPHHRKANSPS